MIRTFPCPPSIAQKDYELMLETYRAIMADLSQPMPTINQLSKNVFMSPSKFRTLFIKIFGMSIYHCHLNARMHLAKELLLHSSFSIEQISYRVGFNRSQSFAKAFLLHEGQTASQYRKAYSVLQK